MSARFLLISIVSMFIIGMLGNLGYAVIDPETVVGAWLFEETSGNTAKDSSGKGNDGAIQGTPQLVNGRFGKALEFDGQEDHVIVKDSDSLDLNEMTVAAWVNLSAYADDQRVISKEEGIADPYSVYSLQISGTGDTKLEFRPTLNGARQQIASGADVPLNEWTHVAATYDGSEVVLYIDGEIDKQTPATGDMMVNDKDLWIGASEFWTPRFFNGIMDDAVLFSVALSQNEIKELMEIGLPNILAVFPAGKLTSTWGSIKID
ncbi:LamG domain-containing protein [Candidatus Poribacteria bacterium]